MTVSQTGKSTSLCPHYIRVVEVQERFNHFIHNQLQLRIRNDFWNFLSSRANAGEENHQKPMTVSVERLFSSHREAAKLLKNFNADKLELDFVTAFAYSASEEQCWGEREREVIGVR